MTRLWLQAGFKHNHVDSEATPRHCHPLCPLPVAAAELLPSPLSVCRLTLSILSLQRHTFMSPASSEGKRKKTKQNSAPKIEKHTCECTQTHTHRGRTLPWRSWDRSQPLTDVVMNDCRGDCGDTGIGVMWLMELEQSVHKRELSSVCKFQCMCIYYVPPDMFY